MFESNMRTFIKRDKDIYLDRALMLAEILEMSSKAVSERFEEIRKEIKEA